MNSELQNSIFYALRTAAKDAYLLASVYEENGEDDSALEYEERGVYLDTLAAQIKPE